MQHEQELDPDHHVIMRRITRLTQIVVQAGEQDRYNCRVEDGAELRDGAIGQACGITRWKRSECRGHDIPGVEEPTEDGDCR